MIIVAKKGVCASEAINAAAQRVLQIRIQQPDTKLHDVIYEQMQAEITASNISTDDAGFEALRLAVFDDYCALRVEAGLDIDEGI